MVALAAVHAERPLGECCCPFHQPRPQQQEETYRRRQGDREDRLSLFHLLLVDCMRQGEA